MTNGIFLLESNIRHETIISRKFPSHVVTVTFEGLSLAILIDSMWSLKVCMLKSWGFSGYSLPKWDQMGTKGDFPKIGARKVPTSKKLWDIVYIYKIETVTSKGIFKWENLFTRIFLCNMTEEFSEHCHFIRQNSLFTKSS